MEIIFEKIKLVIWDLDNTFWRGVLSEEKIHIDEKKMELIKKMAQAGVMSSICSYNEREKVIEILKEVNIWDYFVFPDVGYVSSKGVRIKNLIETAGLRDENVLFIDDEKFNREEVLSVNKNIMVADEGLVDSLVRYFESVKLKDKDCVRLNNYKILEKKQAYRKAGLGKDNETFLFESDIRVVIKDDCNNHIERINELITRTNQLNFTKKRISFEELQEILSNTNYISRYICVNDRFGDYGIVGFYTLDSIDNTLIHFLFSCRVLNMGVEQYVFNVIGRPHIIINGTVASDLLSKEVTWINRTDDDSTASENKRELKGKILFKGPCDLSQLFSFICEHDELDTEFNYVGIRGGNIESHNHSVHIVNSLLLNVEDKIRLSRVPFGDKDLFATNLFLKYYDVILFSTLTDANLGIYQEKETGYKIAFGEWIYDLTNPKNWDGYINGSIFNAGFCFDYSSLKEFSENFVYCGRISIDEFIENLQFIRNNIDRNCYLFLTLGSEIPYIANKSEAYSDRHLFHRQLNDKVREFAHSFDNVRLIDFNMYIHDQNDFVDNINHYKRRVYYQVAKDVINIFNEIGLGEQEIRYDPFIHAIVKDSAKRGFNKVKRVLGISVGGAN